MGPVRVRFAPSPTGHMHIGNLRTALFNWLFARHYSGTFLIRIEDTDLERSLAEYTTSILNTLHWFGIESDEPLVIQSERSSRHLEVAHRLLAQQKAYKCFCTPEELRLRLGENAAEGEGYVQYDALCRAQLPSEQQKNQPFVIRFKVPDERAEITFEDLVRGPVTFKREQFDDFIIVRSDGSPMYNFVVVVDDADMGITHVIRGEDHISNTPKQIMLYQGCEFDVPAFAHLSLILGPHGNRLSKRDAATGVLEYKQAGFLAEALRNYLVRLGWSHGDQEVFTTAELIRSFTLEGVGKKGAIFDLQKLEWMNGVYIRQTSPSALVDLIIHDYDPGFKNRLHQAGLSDERIEAAVALYQDRSKTMIELMQQVNALVCGPDQQQVASLLASLPAEVKNYCDALLEELEAVEELTKQLAEELVKKVCQHYCCKLPAIAQPLRIILTGSINSPSVYSLLILLGKEEVAKRIRSAFKEMK